MFGFGRKTNTLAQLEVSASVFDEIAAKLRDAGYDHAFVNGMLDLSGVGLTRGAEPVRPHRVALRGTAPGAIS